MFHFLQKQDSITAFSVPKRKQKVGGVEKKMKEKKKKGKKSVC